MDGLRKAARAGGPRAGIGGDSWAGDYALLDADAAVFGMPMHNWCMPSVFKAYIDNIIRMGVTFLVRPDGSYQGMLAGKPLLFVTSRGGDLRPGTRYEKMDMLTPAVRTAFEFIGADRITFVDAQPLQFADPDARAAALDRAKAALTGVAARWAPAAWSGSNRPAGRR